MNWYKGMCVLLLVLFLGSCAGLEKPRAKIEFYTLEYKPVPITDLEPLPIVIRLVRFSVAPAYNSVLMIYRDGSFKRKAYFYHKWRANPGDLVTYFLSRDMKQSGLFKAVLPYDSAFPSSYVVEGSVDQLFERHTTENWEAVLTISITLMAENEPDISKRVIFQKTYGKKEPCKQKNPVALAEAMSQAMADISEKITRDVYSHLKNRIRGK